MSKICDKIADTSSLTTIDINMYSSDEEKTSTNSSNLFRSNDDSEGESEVWDSGKNNLATSIDKKPFGC